MILEETVRVGLGAIRANKLRTFLTTLGIIIGVAAVITTLALGAGAERAVQDRVRRLGPDVLTVHPGQSYVHGVATATHVNLTVDDDTALAAQARYVANVVPELTAMLQVQQGDKNLYLRVLGTTPKYLAVHDYTVTAGRMFTAGDEWSRRRFAVLGAAVPAELGVNPVAVVGTELTIRGIPFRVIGVLSEEGAQGSWENPDERILIPLETARYRVLGTDRLSSIAVQVDSLADMNLAMIEIERVLRAQHRLLPGAPDDFRIHDHRDILATYESTAQTFSSLLAGVAAVSLLVGGIGIMNIMLVSVTERTREIGTRRALGARRRDILVQFLVEAVVLCLAGGILGVVSGVAGAALLADLAQWNTLIAPAAIALALAFSALVGLAFGLWPARRAARLDPVEALRYE